MEVRTSQYNPEKAIPEKSWAYWIAKKLFFNDFGAYLGRNHAEASAPAVLKTRRPPEKTLVPLDLP